MAYALRARRYRASKFKPSTFPLSGKPPEQRRLAVERLLSHVESPCGSALSAQLHIGAHGYAPAFAVGITLALYCRVGPQREGKHIAHSNPAWVQYFQAHLDIWHGRPVGWSARLYQQPVVPGVFLEVKKKWTFVVVGECFPDYLMGLVWRYIAPARIRFVEMEKAKMQHQNRLVEGHQQG